MNTTDTVQYAGVHTHRCALAIAQYIKTSANG